MEVPALNGLGKIGGGVVPVGPVFDAFAPGVFPVPGVPKLDMLR